MRPVFQSVLTAVVLAIAGVAVAGPFEEALAQEPNSIQSSPVEVVTGSVQEIILTMGKERLFKTSAPYTRLSVADDKIIDVTPQSDREFIFNPKGIGSTNVFIFDAKNMLMANVDINVVSGTAKTQEVKHEEAPGNVTIYRSLARPEFYRCNATNCDPASEALGVESLMDQRGLHAAHCEQIGEQENEQAAALNSLKDQARADPSWTNGNSWPDQIGQATANVDFLKQAYLQCKMQEFLR